ncbi:hypothetical protein CHO01_09850 [Cellulomonas hominis]|uniref:Uncharacterized protein n=1 Tax=Cellulomonas hominis TaxID=156981 RepID=A0A511F9B3_9CELL|nr:hypothetical protein CHO01_09850 [Cellulomonas hominis]
MAPPRAHPVHHCATGPLAQGSARTATFRPGGRRDREKHVARDPGTTGPRRSAVVSSRRRATTLRSSCPCGSTPDACARWTPSRPVTTGPRSEVIRAAIDRELATA